MKIVIIILSVLILSSCDTSVEYTDNIKFTEAQLRRASTYELSGRLFEIEKRYSPVVPTRDGEAASIGIKVKYPSFEGKTVENQDFFIIKERYPEKLIWIDLWRIYENGKILVSDRVDRAVEYGGQVKFDSNIGLWSTSRSKSEEVFYDKEKTLILRCSKIKVDIVPMCNGYKDLFDKSITLDVMFKRKYISDWKRIMHESEKLVLSFYREKNERKTSFTL